MPEVSSIHNNIGTLRRGKLGFGIGFFEMAQDGLTAASVSCGKLCGGLFAYGVRVPSCLWIDAVAAVEILVPTFAFVLLATLMLTILFDLF